MKKAGFDRPRLFVDGGSDSDSWEREFELEVTLRGGKPVRSYGNWICALWEMYSRQPNADRYAMFQDDFVTYVGLREYLDACPYPGENERKEDEWREKRDRLAGGKRAALARPRINALPDRGYWNLYTMPSNDYHREKTVGAGHRGWYKANQFGRGAVALVFNREAVIALLESAHMADRPAHSDRGWKGIDGGVVTAMEKAGWSEYVHNPSLVQHAGQETSMGSRPQPLAPTFLGEGYDARTLLSGMSKESNL